MAEIVKKSEIDKILSLPATAGKKMIFKSAALPLGILEDHEVLDNEAEIHKKEGDLWLCLEGEAEFIYGGELVEPWAKKMRTALRMKMSRKPRRSKTAKKPF